METPSVKQVFLKPREELIFIIRSVRPTVFGSYLDDQFEGNSTLFSDFPEALGLEKRNYRIGIAVNDEHGGGRFAYMVNRRHMATECVSSLGCLGLRSEGRLPARLFAYAHGHVAWLGPIAVVGGWIKYGGCLYCATSSIDEILGSRVTGTCLSGEG